MATDANDDLLSRLRERIADPERRVDARPSEFDASISAVGAGDLFGLSRAAAADLRRLLDHGVDDELRAKADAYGASMSTPATRPLPGPATPEAMAAAEALLGVTLPSLLRRLYLEVANGGFGPGFGILGISGGWTTGRGQTIEDLYADLSDPDPEHPDSVWPAGLAPLVDDGGVFSCIDTTTEDGRIVEWDPDGHSFREEAPSLAAWLEEWLDRPPPGETDAQRLTDAMSTVPEVTRAYWAAMTREQRAEYGLPAVGWGRAMFGDAWGDDPRDQG